MDELDLMQELDSWPGRRLRLGEETYEVCAVGTPPYIGGGEGLVELLRHQNSGARYMLKCFFQPTEERRRRAKILCNLALARNGASDVLEGAPLAVIDFQLAECVPFALISKWCDGEDWRRFRNKASERCNGESCPPDWPGLKTRLLWAYGLARAIELLEKNGVVHVDISPGNVMVSERPDGAHLSIVDFDGYCAPSLGVAEAFVRGAPSYAAPEIRTGAPEIGSDRFGMALLIQEFVVSGHPLYGRGSLEVSYSAEQLEQRKARSLPFLDAHFKSIAELVDQTLQASTPASRPRPVDWMTHLKEAFRAKVLEPEVKRTSNRVAPKLDASKWFGAVVIKTFDPPNWWDLSDEPCELDLDTQAGVGGVLIRTSDKTLMLTAKSGRRIGFEWRPAEFLYLPDAPQVVIEAPGKIQDLETGKHIELDGVMLARSAS